MPLEPNNRWAQTCKVQTNKKRRERRGEGVSVRSSGFFSQQMAQSGTKLARELDYYSVLTRDCCLSSYRTSTLSLPLRASISVAYHRVPCGPKPRVGGENGTTKRPRVIGPFVSAHQPETAHHAASGRNAFSSRLIYLPSEWNQGNTEPAPRIDMSELLPFGIDRSIRHVPPHFKLVRVPVCSSHYGSQVFRETTAGSG